MAGRTRTSRGRSRGARPGVRSTLAQKAVLAEAKAKGWDKQAQVQAAVEQARREIVVRSYLASVNAPPADYPSDAELQSAYDKNRAAFTAPRALHVAQIYIAVPPNADAATLDKARKQAADLASRARGGDFAALAKANSQDKASAANGGDLGFVPDQLMVPAVRQAADALKPGRLRADPDASGLSRREADRRPRGRAAPAGRREGATAHDAACAAHPAECAGVSREACRERTDQRRRAEESARLRPVGALMATVRPTPRVAPDARTPARRPAAAADRPRCRRRTHGRAGPASGSTHCPLCFGALEPLPGAGGYARHRSARCSAQCVLTTRQYQPEELTIRGSRDVQVAAGHRERFVAHCAPLHADAARVARAHDRPFHRGDCLCRRRGSLVVPDVARRRSGGRAARAGRLPACTGRIGHRGAGYGHARADGALGAILVRRERARRRRSGRRAAARRRCFVSTTGNRSSRRIRPARRCRRGSRSTACATRGRNGSMHRNLPSKRPIARRSCGFWRARRRWGRTRPQP